MRKVSQLKDLFPEECEFKTSAGVRFELRAATIEDFAWMQQKFGREIVGNVSRTNIDVLGILLFRLLKNKEDFSPSDETDFDDDGNKVNVRITGPMKVIRSLLTMKDLEAASAALSKSLGADDLEVDHEDRSQKKTSATSISSKSSISSPASTDGPLTSSET